MSNQLSLFGQAMQRGAEFSHCGRYRYRLSRIWETGLPLAMIIGLNPSTADASEDDATIRRCISFMRREGFGGFYMVNLFAFIATEPRDMKLAGDPIGSLNDELLTRTAERCEKVIFAWGADGDHLDRNRAVASLFPDAYCFGHTKDGHPRHPLFLASDTPLIPFFTPAPHDDGFIFCCKHCQGPLDITDEDRNLEYYKCQSCGRVELLEKSSDPGEGDGTGGPNEWLSYP